MINVYELKQQESVSLISVSPLTIIRTHNDRVKSPSKVHKSVRPLM